MPENVGVYEIYQMVADQHIMGPGGPVGLNLVPVFEIMKMRGVADQDRCLELVRRVYFHMLRKGRDKL